MIQSDKNSTEEAAERLILDHLFDPTNKSQWINKLIEEGFKEEDAKHAYKIAAPKYHASMIRIKK